MAIDPRAHERRRLAAIVALVTALVGSGCTGGAIESGRADGGRRDARVIWREGGTPPDQTAADTQRPWDAIQAVDLTARAGDPCTYGKCAEGLICMANICRAICSSDCGDKAPECAPGEGCHWETSFSAVCIPGTGVYPQPCATNGVICAGGFYCVSVNSTPYKCLPLCKAGYPPCPANTACGTTNNGCQVCLPYM